MVSKINEDKMKPQSFKYDNVVKIKAGDKVTYRVYVYNNSNVNAREVYVRDEIPAVSKIVNIYRGIRRDNTITRTNVTANWTKVENIENTYEYKITDLPANGYTFFDITLSFEEYSAEKKIRNDAAINRTVPTNNTRYRIVDRDYVEMDPLDVSLQKYIVKVNNNELSSNETDLMDRKNTYTISGEKEAGANKIVSKSEANNMKPENTYKYNHIVSIEAGDEVTYRIHVYNNSNVLAKKVFIRDYLDNTTNYEIVRVTRNGGTEDLKGNLENTETPGIKQYIIEGLASEEETYLDVTIKFKEYIGNDIITNTAWINSTDPENTTEYRTLDRDYVKMKQYAVSLEKYIHKINENALLSKLDFNGDNRVDQADVQYLQMYIAEMSVSEEIEERIHKYGDINRDGEFKEDDITKLQLIINGGEVREGYAEHDYDDDINTNNSWKSNHVETVSHNDYVTYTIKVKNDGTTNVYIPSITDILPYEVSDFSVVSAAKYYKNKFPYDNTDVRNKITAELDSTASTSLRKIIKISSTTQSHMLLPGEYILVDVKVRVTASNMSLKIYKNTANITQNKVINKNGIELIDTTPNNNEDSDYFQLNFRENEIVISGKVWNDIAPDKNSGVYNGKYDENYEKTRLLKGIKVYLYRKSGNTDFKVGETQTDENGRYSFTESNVSGNIKGPASNGKWTGSYYSYYVVFEYDGIKYVPSPDGKSFKAITDTNDYQNNSNAREKLNNESYDGSSSVESRVSFNNKFSTINKDSDIEYERHAGTINDGGVIKPYNPQSIHKNNDRMAIKSSTELFTLQDNDVFIDQIKNINIGLRGRQTFDLSMTNPEVTSVKMMINGKTVEYTDLMTGSNVTLRSSDVFEDAANIAKEITEYSSDANQNIRNSDKESVGQYASSGEQAVVTYKFTIINQSKTPGTASQIINYYDNRYTIKRAYMNNNNIKVDSAESGNNFNAAIITTDGRFLAENEKMEIFVEYAISDLGVKNLNVNEEAKFYNMAEIYEYKTQGDKTEKEFIRGLIDNDSAPGSGTTEKVVLYPEDYDMTKASDRVLNENINRPSTVQYYFNGNDLNKLKKEDDTNNKVLKFTIVGDKRTITGNVFEDNTTVNQSTRVKSGDGIYNDGENTVGGILVRLVELTTNKEPSKINDSEGTIVADTVTDENGNYKFEGFKPGNYIIRFYYGNNKYTVLKNQISENKNANSYNGEDYQATNNSRISNLDYWYLFNERAGVSIGYDNEDRRGTVSQNVVNFDTDKMELLNKIRNNQIEYSEEVKDIVQNTQMYSNTKTISIDVEKRQIDGDSTTRVANRFGEYSIQNMNFGIARVPVTTIDLQKHISSFTIKDATGQNIIASAELKNGNWLTKGSTNVIPNEKFVAEIENNQLQGSKLQITYNITANTSIEKDFKNSGTQDVSIAGLIDYIDTNLSYNEALGENAKYWSVINKSDVIFDEGNGTIDKNLFNTIVSAKEDNPLLKGETSCPITLETTLSSEDTSIRDIINSNLDAYEYINNVEISKLNYDSSGDIVYKDRIRIPENKGWYTILAGKQYDSATSEPLSIVPPFGENNSVMYFVIGAMSLVILAGGVVLIKKYAIKK